MERDEPASEASVPEDRGRIGVDRAGVAVRGAALGFEVRLRPRRRGLEAADPDIASRGLSCTIP